jgi:hypothetical protein
VLIKVDGSDPILRPSMTTGNKIITKTISDVIFIPLESVQAGADSIPFVYLKNGNKQVVVLGESNENNVVIEKGLGPGVLLYLSSPENADNFKLIGEELINIIKDRARAKKAEELRLKEEALRARDQGGEMTNITPEMMQQFQKMKGNQSGQGRTRDTAGMKKMMNMRNNKQGATRDSSSRYKINPPPDQQKNGQNAAASAQATARKF